MIPNGEEIIIDGHNLTFESEPSDCRGCFFENRDSCPDCDGGMWVEEGYPWHTGTPTEEGWYLVAYQHKDKITYRAVRFFLEKGLDMEFLDSEGGIYYPDIWKAIAWQKIEPYRG